MLGPATCADSNQGMGVPEFALVDLKNYKVPINIM